MRYRRWEVMSEAGISIAENFDMKINIVTNWRDRKGLWREGCLLEALFLQWGHSPARVHYTAPSEAKLADLNVFLETVRLELFPLAPRNWYVPHLEWVTEADLAHLPCFDRILCKTREAERTMASFTGRAVYTGWESEDRYDPSVPREPKVLHVAGGSILKGTQSVLDAWEQYRLPYPLTVVGEEQVVKPRSISNVTYRGWVDDTELKRLQNSHRVHLQPSETEGWGHTIYEGLSVNATMITTDLVSEGMGGEVLAVGTLHHGTRCLASLLAVGLEELANSVHYAMDGRPEEHAENLSRDFFLTNREQFRIRLNALLERR